MLAHTLKATGRSLLFSAGRAGIRLGSMLTPKSTARQVARRFFTTERGAPERRRFTGQVPHSQKVLLGDGEVVTYHWGDTNHLPTVLLVHGWNGWAQQLERFVDPLRAAGYAVLAFDHVAHGESPGRHATLPVMTRTVEAILKGIRHPAGVIAHSLGAAAVAGVLSRDRAVPAAVLIAPPTDPRPYLRWVARTMGAPDALLTDVQREAEVVAGVPLEDLVADTGLARRIRTPLLIVHDAGDDEVPIANGEIYAHAPQARMLVTDGLGHRRVLRDLHVVDVAVQFVAEQRKSLPSFVAPITATNQQPEGREHREMLTDVGAMA